MDWANILIQFFMADAQVDTLRVTMLTAIAA